MNRALPQILAILALMMLSTAAARADILYGSATPNTSAPTGALANSGWQYEGMFGDLALGTAIAPNYFLTAAHIGGSDGTNFVYNGQTYITDGSITEPGTDLRIWHVTTSFTSYAPLYNGGSEVGLNMLDVGLGQGRGTAVMVDGNLKGWQFNGTGQAQNWGTNVVSGIFNDPGYGNLISFDFNASLGPNTAALSFGDSGGGVFVDDNGTWKLDGINFGIDGPFSTTGGSDPGFSGAIFDARGLYVGSQNNWTLITDDPTDPDYIPDPVPASSYATRISSNYDWLVANAMIPEPTSTALLLTAALALGRRRSTSRLH